jgi:hypothetical protein
MDEKSSDESLEDEFLREFLSVWEEPYLCPACGELDLDLTGFGTDSPGVAGTSYACGCGQKLFQRRKILPGERMGELRQEWIPPLPPGTPEPLIGES